MESRSTQARDKWSWREQQRPTTITSGSHTGEGDIKPDDEQQRPITTTSGSHSGVADIEPDDEQQRPITTTSGSHSGEGDIEPNDEHIEHIKQAASHYLYTLGGLQAKMREYQTYLHTMDGLDGFLGRLADRHGKVMDSMIVDLQDIGFKGCGMRCIEPHYQEQNDHPLTYLAATFGLSLSATTVLACADKATLEELAVKVAEQQTKMKGMKDSAQELNAIRKELQDHQSQRQSTKLHSDIRLYDLQNQMASARTQLAKLECITVAPSSRHAEPAQASPPTPSEETTGRADSAAEHHCLLCGGPVTRLRNGLSRYLEATQVKSAARVYTPAASPVILEPTTSQSDADQCQPHGEHLEVTQDEPAAHIYTAIERRQAREGAAGPQYFEEGN